MPKVTVTDAKGLIQETGTGFVLNNNTASAPAYLVLTSANGTEYYLHVNDAGNALTLSTSVPTGNQTSAGTDVDSATFT